MYVYNNGSYQVRILEDGTKYRTSLTTEFVPNRYETIDMNISYYCEQNCPYCYIDASTNGLHADISNITSRQFLPYTEVAINYADHPDLEALLEYFKSKRVIANITINVASLNLFTVNKLNSYIKRKLINGIGVSTNKFLTSVPLESPNIVYHTINGITPASVILAMLEAQQKVLVLGYKSVGRGPNLTVTSIPEHEMKQILSVPTGTLSFDNLALDQLNVKSLLPQSIWDNHYMGNEGSASFYYDAVNNTFAKSSSDKDVYFDAQELSFSEMFEITRKLK
jgi:hypothetical protein